MKGIKLTTNRARWKEEDGIHNLGYRPEVSHRCWRRRRSKERALEVGEEGKGLEKKRRRGFYKTANCPKTRRFRGARVRALRAVHVGQSETGADLSELTGAGAKALSQGKGALPGQGRLVLAQGR